MLKFWTKLSFSTINMQVSHCINFKGHTSWCFSIRFFYNWRKRYPPTPNPQPPLCPICPKSDVGQIEKNVLFMKTLTLALLVSFIQSYLHQMSWTQKQIVHCKRRLEPKLIDVNADEGTDSESAVCLWLKTRTRPDKAILIRKSCTQTLRWGRKILIWFSSMMNEILRFCLWGGNVNKESFYF